MEPLGNPGRFSEYNEERPKKGLGGLTLALYAKQLAAEGSTLTPGLESRPLLKAGGRRAVSKL